MKFHLHVVDGNASSSGTTATNSAADVAESSAVLLFAHMTLRCGHLSDVVTVSASTTTAHTRQAHILPHAHNSTSAPTLSDTTTSDDTQVLQAAGAVLTGAVSPTSDSARGLPYAPHIDSGEQVIVPYAYFTTPFAVTEQSLRRAISTTHQNALFGTPAISSSSSAEAPPYFDLIATTDMTTFEYIMDYYQQLRVRCGGSTMGGENISGRGTKPVGVLHILADDPSRAARVLQRVLEMVLKRSGYDFAVDVNPEAVEAGDEEAEVMAAQQPAHDLDDEEENGGNAEGVVESSAATTAAAAVVRRGAKADSWANYIDEAVHLFAQLFNVDVLVALV